MAYEMLVRYEPVCRGKAEIEKKAQNDYTRNLFGRL